MVVFSVILLVLFVIAALLLILLVIIQDENSQGLGGIFGGGSDSTFGSSSGNVLTKITYIVGGVFLLLVFSLAFVNRTPDSDTLLKSIQENPTAVEQVENWWAPQPAVTE